MAKRYAISPIIGSGTVEDPYRAAIAEVPETATSALIPSKPDGSPKWRFAFVLFDSPRLIELRAVSNALVFPDHATDSRMDAMQGQTRSGWKQSVEAYDLDGQGTHLDAANVDAESFRDVLLRLVQQLDPGANFDAIQVRGE